ncbi:hypothetical protein KQX54_021383 [Cotesia glomerata]|uniref:Uncharacterized protein n=1 Tax=Cotesia glomerata TaxID=32391 RepID=A0AAV7J9I9_COTGL|nr:hypothetical protein KQX54_021383 [Cotesia glomerata]
MTCCGNDHQHVRKRRFDSAATMRGNNIPWSTTILSLSLSQLESTEIYENQYIAQCNNDRLIGRVSNNCRPMSNIYPAFLAELTSILIPHMAGWRELNTRIDDDSKIFMGCGQELCGKKAKLHWVRCITIFLFICMQRVEDTRDLSRTHGQRILPAKSQPGFQELSYRFRAGFRKDEGGTVGGDEGEDLRLGQALFLRCNL